MGRGGLLSRWKGREAAPEQDLQTRLRQLNETRVISPETTPESGEFSIQLSKDRGLGDTDMVEHYCKTMSQTITDQQKDALVDWLYDNRTRSASEIAAHFYQQLSQA